MKKLILLTTLVLSGALYKTASAQVGITVNIGSQPVWGPTGYDYAEYYYFPDMDVYYNVPERQFVYFDRGNWINSYSLPACYRNYDLYNTYKVVINEPRPFMRNDYWRSHYASYRGRRQENIYNSRDPRYYVINEHPEHGRWMASRQGNDRWNNRGGDYGRNDDRRFERNPRSYDMGRNDRERNDRYDNRRWNENNGRGDRGRFNGGRRD